MKKVLLAVILMFAVVFIACEANAQLRLSTLETPKASITAGPYFDVTALNSGVQGNRVMGAGLETRASNVFMGAEISMLLDWSKVDVRTKEVRDTCTNPNGCVWPGSFVDSVKQANDDWSVRIKIHTPICLWCP